MDWLLIGILIASVVVGYLNVRMQGRIRRRLDRLYPPR